jgi:hypothetical protein
VQFGAAAPDAGTKAHDRVAVNASQTLNAADADALAELPYGA